MQKITKIITANGIILFALLLALLFFIQKGEQNEANTIEELAQKALLENNIREVYGEATTKPYYETHPEELEITEIKYENFMFTKSAGTGEITANAEKEFRQGEEITFAFDVYDYMDPKTEENKYVYGIKADAETVDSEGNIVNSLTQAMADSANYHQAKDLIISFSMGMMPDQSVAAGDYTLKITITDKISGKTAQIEERFKII